MVHPAVEIVVQDVAGARIAAQAGVDRIELCGALGTTGGITPSRGLMEAAVAQGVEVHPLIRPRSGDFVYSPDEVDLVVQDIRHAIEAGCAGVVIGALREDHTLDSVVIKRFVAAAGDAQVTVHRAVDVLLAAHPGVNQLLDDLAELSIDRILTSGGKPTSGQGLDVLAQLVDASAGRVQIMAGGGVTVAGISDLLRTGIDAVHLSAKVPFQGGVSGPGGGDQSYDVTDALTVARAVEQVRSSVPETR